MAKTIKIILGLALIVGVLWVLVHQSEPGDKITIAVFQTLSHPALDNAKNGFVKTGLELFKDGITFEYFNAEGLVSQANLIANKLAHDRRLSGIYCIGTLACQTLVQLRPELPIFFAAVSEPKSIGISGDEPNIKGVSDSIDAQLELQIVAQLFEGRHISLLFNPAELNSAVQKGNIHTAAQNLGFTVRDFAVDNLMAVSATLGLACRNHEIVLIPTDNLMASSMPMLSKLAHKSGCPVVASDVLLVKDGATAGIGVDYEAAGEQNARLAYQHFIDANASATISGKAMLRVVVNPQLMAKFGAGAEIPQEVLGVEVESN